MATKFNPENKETLTYAEALRPAMEITEQADADQYLAAYIEYMERMLLKEPRTDGMTAEQICKVNIGYYAWYYSHETQYRIEKLFLTKHPIFGKAIETSSKPQP